jgi:hypothetical protein
VDIGVVGGERLEVFGIRRRHDSAAQPYSGRNDDCVDRGTHASLGSKLPRQPDGSQVQPGSAYAADKQPIDTGVSGVAPIDLGQHDHWDDALRSFPLRSPGDGERTGPQLAARR